MTRQKIALVFILLAITCRMVLLTQSAVNALTSPSKAGGDRLIDLAPGDWTPLPVADDPLVRMPGSQPGQISLESANRCLNCHRDINQHRHANQHRAGA